MHSWSMKVVQGVVCKSYQRSVPTMWFEVWVEEEVADARNPIRQDETPADVPPLAFGVTDEGIMSPDT